MYLFNINKKGTILIHPEAVKLCPELSVLDEKEIRFLILAYDYESPFNQQPEQDRLHRAKHIVYNNEEIPDLKSNKWIAAINAYKGLQYNPKREMMRVYENKLITLSKELERDLSSIEIKKILDSQKQIRLALKELNEELMDAEEMKITIKGGGELSFIERITTNATEYKRITEKRD